MIKHPKAIIFDRDGVIIDTETIYNESVKYALRKLNIEFSDIEVPTISGRSLEYFHNFLMSKWEFDFEEYRRLQRDYYYKNLDKAPYYTEIIDYIKYLFNKNITLALTTSAGNEGTLLILEKIGIKDLFKVIVTKEDCSKHKPDPEPYLITARKLNISPEDCVVIEDSSSGVESAKSAGMYCIAFPNQNTNSHDFSKADFMASKVEDIKNHLTI